MEYENKYSSRGVGNAGLTLGVIDTALGALSGGLGNIGIGRTGAGCPEDHCVSRYELGLQQEISAKDSRIALLEANTYVDGKLADVYEKLNGKIAVVEAQIAQQNVYNATNTAITNCLAGQVGELMALTKRIVPNSSICPGWGDVTVSIPTTPAGA